METTAPDVTIDATIGQVVTASALPSVIPKPSPTLPRKFSERALSIYGFGPPDSVINLKGIGVSESIKSNQSGYFRFEGIYSHTSKYPELCVYAQDQENRITQPSCIPALPVDRTIPLEVGPILLSPTISLNSNRIVVGNNGFAVGKTSPNIEVSIYVSKTTSNNLSLIKEVSAYTFPVIKTKSDQKGEFTIGLPTSNQSDYRIYAFGKYGEDLSAKSTTLQFSVVGAIKDFYQDLGNLISQNKILTVIFLELILVIILLMLALKRTTVRIKRINKS
jgi:hypothetical protein